MKTTSALARVLGSERFREALTRGRRLDLRENAGRAPRLSERAAQARYGGTLRIEGRRAA